MEKKCGLFRYIVKKCFRMVLLAAAVSVVTFILMKSSPVDPLQTNVGQTALGSMSPEQIEKLRAYWGVGVSPVRQYLSWALDFLQGDMGTSLLYHQPVAEVIGERLFNSLFVMAAAWVLSGVLGFVLGVVSAMKQGTFCDRIIKGYCVLISAAPTFWLALFLLIIFGVWLGIFPVGLSVPVGTAAAEVTLADRLLHAVLPAVTLGIIGVSSIALHTREKMLEILDSDYILFARARGEKGWKLFWDHGLRNAILPALTLQFASISEIFGGAVLVEQVFSYPGLGQAAVTAGLGSDMPLLMGIVVISSLFVFGGNLTADILYGVIDPRIRRGGERL